MDIVKPQQRLSYTEKIAKDSQWGKDQTEYFIRMSSFYSTANPNSDRDIGMLYAAYNGKLSDLHFNFVTNPLGSSDKQYKSYPAKIRRYSIIRPNIDLIWGEYSRRPWNYVVQNLGEDSYNGFLEAKKQTIIANLEQHFINIVNANGVTTGEESQQVATPVEVSKEFEANYTDMQAITGQKTVTAMEAEYEIREKQQDMFLDFLIAGEAYSFKDVQNGDLVYEAVNPMECDYDKSPHVKYIEDGNYFIRRRLMTLSDILDNPILRNEIDKEEYLILESDAVSGSGFYSPLSTSSFLSNTAKENSKNKVEVIHCTWKSQRKIGYLTYPNPITQEIEEIIVDESYVIDKNRGEAIKWDWVNEWWESYRIAGDKYLGIRPVPIQRNSMNNFSRCKGMYNGIRFSDKNTSNTSPYEICLPYEIMHVIYKYRLELTVAKNKGKIALLDQNIIPNKPGWTEEKTLYFADALGYFFMDRNQIGVDKSFNQYQVLDMDLLSHIDKMIQLIENNKNECDEALGINRQRKGQVSSSDGVGSIRQAAFQSSIISDIIFTKFEGFVRREYQGLLDYSKFLHLEGKKMLYRNSDLRTEILNVDPDKYCNADLGIYYTNSTKEQEKLEMLKQQAQAFAQNQGKPPSLIADIIGSENFIELNSKLKNLEKMEAEFAQQNAATEHEREMEKLSIQKDYEQLKSDLKIQQDNNKAEHDKELVYIQGDIDMAIQGAADANANGTPDINEIESRALDREAFYHEKDNSLREQYNRERELSLKDKEITIKANTEKYKADTALKIAKENKTKSEMSKK